MTNQKDPAPTPHAPQTQPGNDLAIVSLVLGIMSLTGPGFLLGIPAIITASIALKKNRSNQNLSITGLITGITSTVFSLIFLAFIVLMIIWGIDHPEDSDYRYHKMPMQSEQLFGSPRT